MTGILEKIPAYFQEATETLNGVLDTANDCITNNQDCLHAALSVAQIITGIMLTAFAFWASPIAGGLTLCVGAISYIHHSNLYEPTHKAAKVLQNLFETSFGTNSKTALVGFGAVAAFLAPEITLASIAGTILGRQAAKITHSV